MTAALILCLTVGGLWSYWGRQIPLTDILPEGNWTKLQMWMADDTTDEWIWEIEPPALEDVLSAIAETRGDRNDKDKELGARYFQILLYREESSYPTLIYVREYGKLAIAVDYDLDHYRYYEHCEELYDALVILTENCPVKE